MVLDRYKVIIRKPLNEHKKETINEFSKRHDYQSNVMLKLESEQDDHHIQKELKAGSSTEEIMKHKLKKLEQRVD